MLWRPRGTHFGPARPHRACKMRAVAMAPSNPIAGDRSGPTDGTLLSHYRLVERLGAGGMGVVFRAVDTRLNRTVALKVIAHDALPGDDRRRRFLKEARAASTFNHPNIVTIHEVDQTGGTDFIVMELVSGQPLDRRIRVGGLPVDEVLSCAEQIASALEAAHDAGIVHRDIKPGNVMVSDAGHVKVLDFGIAKQLATGLPPEATTATAAAPATAAGALIGSLAYMSPEQAQGRPIDGRSDVFSLGVVLYEMLSGQRPFAGATMVETLAKLLESQPPALGALRPDLPQPLVALVQACLEKDRTRRPTAQDVHRQVRGMRQARSAAAASVASVLRRPAVAVPAALVIVALLAGAAFWWASGRGVAEARRRVPELLQLADRDDYFGFYRVGRSVVPVLADDVQLKQLWVNMTFVASFDSNPSGAEAFIKGYTEIDAPWIPLGRTPIAQVRVPFGNVRLKLVKSGFTPIEAGLNPFSFTYTLDAVESTPVGMVRVPAVATSLEDTRMSLPTFWLDRLEVSNRQFKAFVDAGGYEKPELWQEAFGDRGRSLTWREAMTRFRDKTGRPGPSTWELGTYLDGQAQLPVGGVSWYEAAAYAVFVHKTLPTAYQWRAAGGFGGPEIFSEILLLSNFGTKGPAAVGSHHGLAPWGALDLAGNVKEWCWNETAGGRMILGGGWNEPSYMFDDRDAQPALARLETYGIRLVQNVDPQPPTSYAVVRPRRRDFAAEAPLDDAAFELVRGLYRYDPGPLDVRVEATDDTPQWRHETVTFNAAYGGERLITHVYLPRSASPPFQPIVYFPGGDAQILRSSRDLRLTETQFVIRSGRALVYPVYKGTFERPVELTGANAFRDTTIARVKDFGRVLDFIETRPDLDRERIGYYGLSLGAFTGVIATAIEPRVKASVLLGGGLSRSITAAEIDAFNFAPRVRVPTLMVNGRNDFSYPVETSQLPLFRLLGLPADRKRHAVLEGGHQPLDMHALMREVLDWFDRHLGPVAHTTGGAAR